MELENCRWKTSKFSNLKWGSVSKSPQVFCSLQLASRNGESSWRSCTRFNVVIKKCAGNLALVFILFLLCRLCVCGSLSGNPSFVLGNANDKARSWKAARAKGAIRVTKVWQWPKKASGVLCLSLACLSHDWVVTDRGKWGCHSPGLPRLLLLSTFFLLFFFFWLDLPLCAASHLPLIFIGYD